MLLKIDYGYFLKEIVGRRLFKGLLGDIKNIYQWDLILKGGRIYV